MTELRCAKCSLVVMRVEGKETTMRKGTVLYCQTCDKQKSEEDSSFDALMRMFSKGK